MNYDDWLSAPYEEEAERQARFVDAVEWCLCDERLELEREAMRRWAAGKDGDVVSWSEVDLRELAIDRVNACLELM